MYVDGCRGDGTQPNLVLVGHKYGSYSRVSNRSACSNKYGGSPTGSGPLPCGYGNKHGGGVPGALGLSGGIHEGPPMSVVRCPVSGGGCCIKRVGPDLPAKT
jgi:hypothetical protein